MFLNFSDRSTEAYWKQKREEIEYVIWDLKLSLISIIECPVYDILHADAGRNMLSWCPPSLDCYKVSIACNFTSRTNKVGVGVLIKDYPGLWQLLQALLFRVLMTDWSDMPMLFSMQCSLLMKLGFVVILESRCHHRSWLVCSSLIIHV